MQFEEISPRSKVIVTVTNGSDLQARFMSKVMRNCKEYALAIPFRHKGVRINFDGKNVKIHLEVRDNAGVLWSFKNCKITSMKKDGLLYHKIMSGMTNGIEDRRGGRRFYIWEGATFEIEGIVNHLFTKIRDIGPEGFSFVVDSKKDIQIKDGSNVNCTMKNNKGDEIKFSGMVVRKESLEKYVVIGCKLSTPDPMVLAYINYLEHRNVVVDAEL